MTKTLGMVLLFVGCAGLGVAAVTVAPEIDPGSAASAVALTAGALLVVRARRK